MKTKLNPFEKLKSVFRPRPAAQPEVGAVVYRKTKGDLTILLLKDKRGSWSVPAGKPAGGETSTEAALRLIKEKAGLTELKVWQDLGQISFKSKPAKRDSARLQLFLVQALETAEGQTEPAGKETAWLPVREAAGRVGYEEVAGIINLAAAKIRRAQI